MKDIYPPRSNRCDGESILSGHGQWTYVLGGDACCVQL